MAIYSGFTHKKWWCSIVTWQFTRGYKMAYFPTDFLPFPSHPPSLPSRCNSSSLSKPSWLSSTALKIPEAVTWHDWLVVTSSGAKKINPFESTNIVVFYGDIKALNICKCILIHVFIKKDGTSIANNYPLVILELCPITALYTIGLSSSLRKAKLDAWHVPTLLYYLIGQTIPKTIVIGVIIPNRCFSKLRYPHFTIAFSKEQSLVFLSRPV